jgi:peptidoglycan/LPS O-acetylase OafA/YrhL
MSTGNRLAVINGLRGVAIIGTFQVHTLAHYTPPESLFGLGIILSGGWLGVNLFFVLSGFVLYLPLSQDPTSIMTRAAIANFYRRRSLRLLPLFFIAILFCLYFWPPEPGKMLALLIGEITATYWFFPALGDIRGDPALWSIVIEIWLSAALPLLLLFRRSVGFVALIGMLFAATTAYKWIAIGDGGPLVPEQYWRIGVYFHSMTEFAVGMYAAHCWKTENAVWRVARSHPAATFGVGLALIYVMLRIYFTNYERGVTQHLHPIHNLFLDPGLFLVVIGSLALPIGKLRSILTSHALQAIGIVCFSFYVWHQPVLELCSRLRIGTGVPGDLFFTLLMFVLTFVVALVSFRLIEFPRTPLSLSLSFAGNRSAGTVVLPHR